MPLCGPAPPVESIAVMANEKVPACAGDPDNTPFAASVTPSGSAPDESANEYGAMPPVALRPCEYATPNAPSGSVAGATTIVGCATVNVYVFHDGKGPQSTAAVESSD